MVKNSFFQEVIPIIKKFIFRNLESYQDQDSLEFLKEKIFSMLSFLISISIGPIMLYGSIMFYREGDPQAAAFESLLCILILIALNTNLFCRYAKHLFTVIAFYLAGILLIIYTGPSGAGMVCLVFSFILSLSFLSRRHSTVMFIVNVAVMTILTILLFSDVMDRFAIIMYKPTWIMNVVCLLLCIVAMFYVWDHIFSRLSAQLTALKLSEEKYRTIAGNTADVIWVVDLETMNFTYISPSVERLRGFTAEEAMTHDIFETMPKEYGEMVYAQIGEALGQIKENGTLVPTVYAQIQQFCKDGSLIWVEFSAQCRYNEHGGLEAVGVSRDITERMQKEEKIKYISTHDQLTTLLNQNALRIFLIDERTKHGENSLFSFIVTDIDSFRVVNESLGHSAGDQMLKLLAEKISEAVGSRGIVYRNDGDEFIVAIPGNDDDMVYQVCMDLRRSIANHIKIRDRMFFLTASIGYSTGSSGISAGTVLKNAGTARYVAKKKRNTIVAYDATMDNQKTKDLLLEQDLYKALDQSELELFFQPIIDAKSGQIDHAEALLRWNHPEYGMISPVEFIPIAEKTRLIIPITSWVFEECCRKLKEWDEIGILGIEVSLNLSLLWFEQRNEEITEFVLNTIKKTAIQPRRIKLEITESILMGDVDRVIKMCRDMREIGFKMALDDFGTGYSSFGYLKDLPIDILKMDRTLICGLVDDRDQMIVHALITIAHELGLNVVAEGVETLQQFEFLKDQGCDLIQGYYFSKPLNSKAFVEYCTKKPSA